MGRGTGTRLPYLRAWREKRGYSLTALGDLSGVSRFSILALEQGKSGARNGTMRLLAEALGITREELIRKRPLTFGGIAWQQRSITPESVRYAVRWYKLVS